MVFVVYEDVYNYTRFKLTNLMSDVNSPLAQRLRALRGERSLYSVAQAMGLDRRHLKFYEDGRIPQSDEALANIASFYAVPFDELKALAFESEYPAGSPQRDSLIRWVKGLLASAQQDS